MNKKWIVGIMVAIVVIAAAVGFGSYSLGVKAGQTQAIAARQRFLADRGVGGNGQGQGGFGGQGGAGQFNPANLAAGEVKQVDGNTIQLSTATEVLTVKVSDQTQIQKMGAGSLSDIQTGERVTVQGTKGADGVFSAERIQIGGRFGGGPPQEAPGSGGQASQQSQGSGSSGN